MSGCRRSSSLGAGAGLVCLSVSVWMFEFRKLCGGGGSSSSSSETVDFKYLIVKEKLT